MASKTSKKAVKKSAAKKSAAKKTTAPKKRATPAKKSAARKAAPKKSAAGSSFDASARIDKMFADLDDWRGERLTQIRKLIHDVDPDVVEDWKWMGTPVWSHDGMFALADPFKGKVKLTFHHGAQLRDPKKLFNAGLGGNKWRAIDFFEGDTIDERALKALLREAIAYNTSHSVPKSKGSRAPR